MNFSKTLLVSSLVLFYTCSFAQETSHSFLPIIGISEGILNFKGDFKDTRLSQPLMAKSGLQIDIEKRLDNNLSIALFFLSGKVSGETNTSERNLNFQTNLFSEGIMFRYEFASKHNPEQVLFPYLTGGIGYTFFHAKSDLKDGNGRTYYYWNEGANASIRSLSSTDSAASDAVLLHRDYTYETSLKDANLDGKGKYKESAILFPVGLGVRFKISDKCALNFSSIYHITSSDYLDGITSAGTGQRQGNKKNDSYIYSSVSFRIDLGVKSVSKGKTSHYTAEDVRNVDFTALANEDADGDGIPDVKDDSSGTPLNNKVDVNGKPIDLDDDGIPDYRDKELNSPKNAVVSEEGITITESMIEEKFRKDSLAALPAVVEYLKSYDRLAERKPEVVKQWVEEAKANPDNKVKTSIPQIFVRLDTDYNGVITPKEISLAIDEYLAKKSPYTVQQFFDLIDFFFTQH